MTTSVPNPSAPTAHMYKSAVTKSATQVSLPNVIQTGTHHQQQEQDLDKLETQSTKLKLSEISETKTIQTLVSHMTQMTNVIKEI